MRTSGTWMARSALVCAVVAVLPSTSAAQAQQGAAANPTAGMLNPSTRNAAAVAEFRAALDATFLWHWKEAQQRARRALELEPSFGIARAVDAFLVGGAPAADNAQRAATDASSATAAEAAFALAIREGVAGRAAVARRFEAAAAEIAPNDRALALWRAWNLGDTARLNALRALNTKYPDLVASRMNLAFQLSPANDSVAKANADEALRVAGEAVQLAPEMSGPHAAIGHVLHALGRDKEAQPHLVAATRLAPTSWHAYQLLAEIAAFDGRIAEMRPLLDSAIALTPNVTNIYNYRRARAMTLLADGNPRQAMIDLEAAARDAEAIGARGQANLTHLFIVSAAAATGDTAAIEQHLTKARSLGAAVGTAADYSLSAYGLTGQPQRARVAYDTLARLNAPQPNLSPATNAARERYLHRQRGWLLLAERKPVEAIAEFRQADVNPYVSVGIVEALQMQKKTKEADAERAAFFERREYSFVSTGVPIMRFRARKK